MTRVNLYLNFAGTTEEAFNFYRLAFGGEFSDLQRYKETPGMEDLPGEDQVKLMHVSLPLGENLILHATDVLESRGQILVPGNNFNIMLETGSKEETDKLFKILSAGGKAEMMPQDMFWGAYYGSCTDKFGIQWMFNYTYPVQT